MATDNQKRRVDTISARTVKYAQVAWSDPAMRRKIKTFSGIVLVANIIIFGLVFYFSSRGTPIEAALFKNNKKVTISAEELEKQIKKATISNKSTDIRSFMKNVTDIGNGQRKAEVYSTPVQYQDEADGKWKDIDPELKTIKNGKEQSATQVSGKKDKEISVEQNLAKTKFSTNPGTDLEFQFENKTITSAYLDVANSPGTIIGENTILYENIYDKVDVERIVLPGEIKQNIILKERGHPLVFREKLDTSLRVELQPDNSILYYEGDKVVAKTPPIFISDMDGARRNVTLKYENKILEIALPGNNLKRLTYPLVIDPSTTVYNQSIDDGFVVKGIDSYGNISYSSNTVRDLLMAYGVNSDCSTWGTSCNRAYLRFPLSGLGPVTSATLKTYGESYYSTNNGVLYHSAPFDFAVDSSATIWGLATDSSQTFTSIAGTQSSHTVTPSVSGDYNAGRAYTYFTIWAGSGGAIVNTRSQDSGAADAPRLDVTYDVNSFSISGTSGLASGTVKVAVAGVLQAQTGSISGGAWTISGVTAPMTGTVITVFVNGVSAGVSKYNGVGNVTGMVLNSHVTSVGSASNQSLSLTDLNNYDYDNGTVGNVIFQVSGTSPNLTLKSDPGNAFSDEALNVLSGNTLTIAGTETVITLGVTIGGTLTSSGNSTYNVAGVWTNNGTFNQGTSATNFNGAGTQIIGGSATTTFNNVTTANTANVTTGIGTNIGGTLAIGNGSTFTAAGYNLTVNGSTTVGGGASGSLVISSSSGTKIFTGLVTTAAGSTWNNSGNSAVTFRGGITNHATATFTAGSGVYTFDTNSQALTGTLSIPSVTVTGVTLTNNNTLTVATALSGIGELAQAVSAALNLGGTVGITTFTAINTGNTVTYNSASAQNVQGASYYNLNLGGSATTATYTAAGTMMVSNVLTIVSSSGVNTFNGSSYTLTLAGTGTPFVIGTNGVFVPSTSTVKYPGSRAIGGTVTYSGGNEIHTFTNSGSLVLNTGTISNASYLVVGGGGGGAAGGGGAGGMLTGTATVSGASTITVGAGGTAGCSNNPCTPYAGRGGNSTFGSFVAVGGGAGGGVNAQGVTDGGSGGGAGYTAGSASGGFGTAGQGNKGGDVATGTSFPSAGGGGAGAVGVNAAADKGGNGGAGLASSISGNSTVYAGGGGGSAQTGILGTGGTGGGGNGSVVGNGTAGTVNTGGGGGGGKSFGAFSGGSGGSGIVIISFPVAAVLSNATGATYYNLNLGGSGNNTTYTAAGNITVLNVLTIVSSSVANTFDASSHTLTLSGTGTPFVIGTNGVFAPSTSTVVYGNTTSANVTVAPYNNLSLTPLTGTPTYTLAGNLTGANAIAGNLLISSGAALNNSTVNKYSIEVKGNWTNSGTFTNNSGGTVTLSGAGGSTQIVTGNTSFYNLTSTATSARTINFASGSTTAVTGIWTCTGTAGQQITLGRAGGSGSTQWNINPTAWSVDYVTPANSNNQAGSTINPVHYTDGGNNTNWFVTNQPPSAPTSLTQGKTTGANNITESAWTNTNQPWFGFSVTDMDSSDTVKYRIQLDNTDSSFTHLVLDYTYGSLSARGTVFAYQVGQSGIYAVGSAAMALPDSATGYWWRVYAIDNSAVVSVSPAYFGTQTTVDMKADATAPTGGSIYDGTSGDQDWNDGSLTSISGNWTSIVPDSNVSGLQKYEYSIRRKPDNYYWTPGSPGSWSSSEYWYNNTINTSFTQNSLNLATGTIYFVTLKTTDNAGNTSTIDSNGQQVLPVLSFSISTNQITFNNLNSSNSYTDSKNVTLSTSTNAAGGYNIIAYMNDFLKSDAYPTKQIPAFSGTWATPITWGAGQYGFGYTTNDSSVQGSNRFLGATKYCSYKTVAPFDIIADNVGPINGVTGSVSNEQFVVTNRVSVSSSQEASKYSGTILYLVTANY